MVLANKIEKEKAILANTYSLFIILIAPLAPHFSEEVWRKLGNKESIFFEKWPEYNPKLIKEKKLL